MTSCGSQVLHTGLSKPASLSAISNAASRPRKAQCPTGKCCILPSCFGNNNTGPQTPQRHLLLPPNRKLGEQHPGGPLGLLPRVCGSMSRRRDKETSLPAFALAEQLEVLSRSQGTLSFLRTPRSPLNKGQDLSVGSEVRKQNGGGACRCVRHPRFMSQVGEASSLGKKRLQSERRDLSLQAARAVSPS